MIQKRSKSKMTMRSMMRRRRRILRKMAKGWRREL
jgi:hypothetical protein